MAVRLAGRADRQPASPIRRLAPFAAAARQRGRHVFPLNIGQPDIPAPREILDRLRTFDLPNVPYGPSEGLPEFIEAIREYYQKWGLDYRSEQLFATTGGSEALLFTLAAIADHGNDVLVFEPFYTNYGGFAAMVGVHTRPVTTHAADGYHLPDPKTIESRIGPKTRAILLCSPNNPTGTVYTDEELEAVGDVCRRRGLFLVADEVYREFTYDGARHRSAATLEGLDSQIVLTDSLSKRVSLCGARVGWIASKNRDLMDAVLRFGQARLCPPTLGQHVGAVFHRIGGDYMRGVVREYEARRNLVFEALDAMPGVLVKRPEGAFYVCAKLPIDDAQSFAEFLLRDFEVDNETVMLAPADGFYATPGAGRDEVRIAYVLNTAELGRAMAVLRAALEAYPGTTG
jgi:aspartate aminotransferase